MTSTALNSATARNLAGTISAVDAFKLTALTASDWHNVVSMALKHGLAAQLYVVLKNSGRLSDMPDELAERIKRGYLGSVARGLQLSTELGAILEHFNKIDIPVIVLKGPHLAEMVYHDWALRPMADFDLLVDKDYLAQAAGALKELGYRASVELHNDAMIKTHMHLAQMCKQNRFFVELHWSLELPASPIKIDLDGVWQRSIKEHIAGVEALVLSNEDLLLYLCIHAAYHHRFSFGLLPIRDIAEVIRVQGDKIDWEKLNNTAEQWRADRCLFLTVYIAQELFNTTIPSQISNNVSISCFNLELVETAKEVIFGAAPDKLPLSGNIAKLWGNKDLLGKAKILLESTLPPPEVLATTYSVKLSDKRIYLYYLVRMWYLLRRYAKSFFLLFRGNVHMTDQLKTAEQVNVLIDWLVFK